MPPPRAARARPGSRCSPPPRTARRTPRQRRRRDHDARAGGQRSSARGGAREPRPVTQITAPPRGPSTDAGGAGPLSTSASRACTPAQPARSWPISIGRRSPGSRIAQPPARAEVDAQRRRRAHRHVEPLLARGRGRVEHDQRSGVELGDQPALEHLAAPRHRRPVDARRRRALAVRPQAVDLELGERGVEAPPQHAGVDAGAAAVARARRRRRRAPSPAPPAAAPAPRRRPRRQLARRTAAAGRGSPAARARARAGRGARSGR